MLDVDLPDIDSPQKRRSGDLYTDADDEPSAADLDTDDGPSTARADDKVSTAPDANEPSAAGSDAGDTEGAVERVADRVSRILDGDLDAREVDASDVGVGLDGDSALDSGGAEDTDTTADVESEESDRRSRFASHSSSPPAPGYSRYANLSVPVTPDAGWRLAVVRR